MTFISRTILTVLANPWTTAHGHFLQMGGFRISTTARENFYVGGNTELGLRRKAFVEHVNLDKSYDGADRNIHRVKHHHLAALVLRLVNSHLIAALGIHLDKDQRTAALGIHPNHKQQIASLTPEEKTILIPFSLRTQNLIFREVHYRHECPEGSWADMISEKDVPYMDSGTCIWEGALSFMSLKTLIKEDLLSLPDISAGEINDRSKSDALSKGVAFVQLTWFIVQIIARHAQGLAITELELTTAALVGLNSIMYIFWWSKPRDMRFPVMIRTKGVEALLMKKKPDAVARTFENSEDFSLRSYVLEALGQNGRAAHRASLLVSSFKKVVSALLHVIVVVFHFLEIFRIMIIKAIFALLRYIILECFLHFFANIRQFIRKLRSLLRRGVRPSIRTVLAVRLSLLQITEHYLYSN